MTDLVGCEHVFGDEEGLQLNQDGVHGVGAAPLDLLGVAVPDRKPPPAQSMKPQWVLRSDMRL